MQLGDSGDELPDLPILLVDLNDLLVHVAHRLLLQLVVVAHCKLTLTLLGVSKAKLKTNF